MATTYRQRELAIDDLKKRIDESRRQQAQAQAVLVDAAAKVNIANMAGKSALAELAADQEADTGDSADKLQQLVAAKLQAEAEILRNYATTALSLWNALIMVDLSGGLTTETKNQIKAILQEALS